MASEKDQDHLRMLEEKQMFAERDAESLSEEVVNISKRVHELSVRLSALERRFDTLTRESVDLVEGENESPPT